MRAADNRRRLEVLRAIEASQIRSDMLTRMDGIEHYVAYDDNGESRCSLALALVRDALGARIERTFHTVYTDEELRPILEVCAPNHETWDETPMARAMFGAYAKAAMSYATTMQLSQWVENYRSRLQPDMLALDVLCRRILRGLAYLRGYLGKLAPDADASEFAADAMIEAVALRMALASDARRWHVLSDATRAYVQTGKLTRGQRKRQHAHSTRRERRRLG